MLSSHGTNSFLHANVSLLFSPQVDTDAGSTLDSQSLPLSSPFKGQSGTYEVYAIGDDTGIYTVSYIPLVRGDYAITVRKLPVWEVQLVLTEVEDTGAQLSGESRCKKSMIVRGLPSKFTAVTLRITAVTLNRGLELLYRMFWFSTKFLENRTISTVYRFVPNDLCKTVAVPFPYRERLSWKNSTLHCSTADILRAAAQYYYVMSISFFLHFICPKTRDIHT